MTTIILTIIGILLAAAAALMVIFYGGDAFNSGSIGARANTYQNAGTNVISAVQLAKADNYAYTDIASLVTPTNGSESYLKENTGLPTGAVQALSGNQYTVELPTGAGSDSDKVCARVNKNLGLGTTVPAAPSATVKMGCAGDATDGFVFYANA